MSLSAEQVRILEQSRSAYGCGLTTCQRCYPIQYACDYCGGELDAPISNGDEYTCTNCSYNNKENN